MSQDSEPRVRNTALERGPGGAYQAYDEPTFRHFLTIERKRAERSGRTALLLLVQLDDAMGTGSLGPSVASELFTALTGCVREIDFIGWYHTGTVVGAVLMQGTDPLPPETAGHVRARVIAALRERVPAAVGEHLEVRVVPARSTMES